MLVPNRFCLFFLAAIALLGQDSTSGGSAHPAAGRKQDDSVIERSVAERFGRSKISVNGFTVEVRDGTAILRGVTDVPQHKGTATRLAKAAGARGVDNRIQISETARRQAARDRRGKPRRVYVQRSRKR